MYCYTKLLSSFLFSKKDKFNNLSKKKKTLSVINILQSYTHTSLISLFLSLHSRIYTWDRELSPVFYDVYLESQSI